MKNVFVTICLLLAVFAAVAQSNVGIQLKKYTNQKTVFVKEGAKIRVMQNGKTYKGKFHVVSDNSIRIESDTIPINQVQIISAKNISKQLGGGVLLAGSTLAGSLGMAITIAGIADGSGYAILGLVIGVPMATLGVLGVVKGIQTLSNGKKFVAFRWEYQIIGATNQPNSK